MTFPPNRKYILLPRLPRRAAYAGLALYDTRYLHQRVALRVGPILARTGLTRFFPRAEPDVDWDWWERWIREVAEPIIGRVEHIALRTVPYRGDQKIHALLMGHEGDAVGFVKVGGRPYSEREDAVWHLLSAAQLRNFRVPVCLAAGQVAGVRYRLHQPLPEGPHRRPPFRPGRLRRTIDEYQDLLADMPRPADVPATHVPCHGDLQVVNVRVGRDGNWWVFDWGGVHWGPQLLDELNYWASELESRVRSQPRRGAVLALRSLRERGADAEILESASALGSQPTNEFRSVFYAELEHLIDTAA